MPHPVEAALAIDRRTDTDFWRLALEKEMKNVMPAFDFPEDGKVPIGYKHIDCHMIFDVKMDSLGMHGSWLEDTRQTRRRSRLIPVSCRETA